MEFSERLYIKEMDIYETYNAGAVVKVELKSPSGEWVIVFRADMAEHITNSRIFSPPLQVR